MTFFNGVKNFGNRVLGGVKSGADYNKDGRNSIGEYARYGLGFAANPTVGAGRLAYNMYKNGQTYGGSGGVRPFEQPYNSQYQYGGNTGGNSWYNGLGAVNQQPINQYAPPQAPQQGVGQGMFNPDMNYTGGGSFNESGAQPNRGGFNFLGAPAMSQSDMNALRMKSEAAGYFNGGDMSVNTGGNVAQRFNVMAGHEAMLRKLDMAKYANELNPNAAYGDAQFQQEMAQRNAGMAQ